MSYRNAFVTNGKCWGKSIGIGLASALVLGACDSSPSTQSPKKITEAAEALPQIDPLIELAKLVSAEDMVSASTLDKMVGVLKRRETVIDVLDRLGADRSEANGAVYAAAKHVDMRRLRPGLDFSVYFEDAGIETTPRLAGLTFNHNPEAQVLVTRKSDGSWVSRTLPVPLTPSHNQVGGAIETSIYDVALKQGANDQQVVDFANIFAYDVDFQREIRAGDTFEITYETFRNERGEMVKNGDVIYAEIDGQRVKRRFYRFTTADDGVTDYYDENGKAARKFLMKTPINGARLSSSFGARRHPVLGYTKMHKGTDFAAPRGTPVYAAGNGIIERASRYGSFGNYIRIRHANGYQTAYAHLNGYARGIKSGRSVKQGQVIGYVGTTGRSTGPHLHYEVLVNGKHRDAMRLKLPTGRTLEGKILSDFQAEKARIDAIRAAQSPIVDYAQAQTGKVVN